MAGAGALLVIIALDYDLFGPAGPRRSDAARLELAEIAAIAVVLGLLLILALRRMRAQNREVARRIAAEQHARELAFQDPLTGLANRRQFDQIVAEATVSPPGAERTHAVLLMDLNGFKSINDVYGHPVGDAVLAEIGFRLLAVMRESGDEVARLGGDEFGVVATHLRSAEDAGGIALRIIRAVEEPIIAGPAEHTVGVGIGIALFPRDGHDAKEIIRRADIALYRAKAESGSVVRFFEKDMDARVRERSVIERELRRALADGDIHPCYQPVVDLGTGAISGAEALARWHHRELGSIAPERFIPVAEECGLIAALGDHLLRVACRDALDWPPAMTLSINVSPVQLREPGFGLRVLAILGEVGLSPTRLELEITENTLVRDLKASQAALGALRAAGVRIALDDFGTGYSSLYHLRNFPVDRIKVDRSFVDSIDAENESAAIVRALLGLGHGLGIAVTAEGIESARQRDFLIGQGCDQGQGFLYAPALPASELRRLIAEKTSKASAG